MCGRFAMDTKVDELVREFVAAGNKAQDWAPAYSVAPSNRAPIVREWRDDEGALQRDVELGKWQLLPGWAKPGMRAQINARFETVAAKPMFRNAFASRRCIVPMSPGYFEWVDEADRKQPHLIHGDGQTLAAAGIYESRKNDDDGSWTATFAIITREAADASGEVHDRMPTFLTPDLWDDWLAPTKLEAGDRDEMLAALDRASLEIAATLTTHPVSRALNSVAKVNRFDPSLVESIG